MNKTHVLARISFGQGLRLDTFYIHSVDTAHCVELTIKDDDTIHHHPLPGIFPSFAQAERAAPKLVQQQIDERLKEVTE